MKIILKISDINYKKAVMRFLDYRWQFKEFIEFRDNISEILANEVLLTDDVEVFKKYKQLAYLLSEDGNLEKRKFSKYISFEKTLFQINPEMENSFEKKGAIKIITVCSPQGGSGKSAVLRHLSHNLNLMSEVAVLNLFESPEDASFPSLSDFVLEAGNMRSISNDYCYKSDYCKHMIAGFRNMNDFRDVNAEELQEKLVKYLQSKGITLLLVKVPHPSLSLASHFVQISDYNIIVMDSRRQLANESKLYLDFLNSKANAKCSDIDSSIVIQNFSDKCSILDLPYDVNLFRANGTVNENSAFYSRIMEFSQGVLNV